MTENYPPASVTSSQWDEPLLGSSSVPDQGTTDVIKDRAADVGQGAADAGRRAAGTAREQASNVTAEAGRQARDLLGQAQAQLRDQASQRQHQLAGNLHALSDELRSMPNQPGQPSLAADLAHQAAATTRKVARWLEEREPGQVVEEVKVFARQRPGTFIAIAAGAGLLAGRLTRGIVSASGPGQPATAGQAPESHGDSSAAGYGTMGSAGYPVSPGLTPAGGVPDLPPLPADAAAQPAIPVTPGDVTLPEGTHSTGTHSTDTFSTQTFSTDAFSTGPLSAEETLPPAEGAYPDGPGRYRREDTP